MLFDRNYSYSEIEIDIYHRILSDSSQSSSYYSGISKTNNRLLLTYL